MSDAGREFRLGEAFCHRAWRQFLVRGAMSAALLLAALLPLPAQASMDLKMADSSVSIDQDAASGKRGVSLDLNSAFAFINMGLSARVWDGAITGWNGRPVNNELIFYGGVGLFDLLTIQRGWSRAGARTRIRAMIGLGGDFPLPIDPPRPGLFGRGAALTPFVEYGGGKRVYGLGLVVTF